MLNRRQLLALALPATTAGGALAHNEPMGPSTPFYTPRKAWVSTPEVMRQECPQWCWAASIAMILTRLGHPMDQKVIVSSTFGGLVCMGAPNTLTIAADLSRPWTDLNGVSFVSRVTAAYDPANGIANLNNRMIIDELSNDRPLLYCNQHHAMVLVVADYLDTPSGPNMLGGAVLDPWPLSPEWHYLSAREFTPIQWGGEMTFLAAVDVATVPA